MKRKTNILPFLIALGAGTALAVVIALLRGMGSGNTTAMNAGIMSDGFFIVGVLAAGVGALMAIAGKTDFFDMLSYGSKSLLKLIPFTRQKHQTFYDYKLEKQAKRKEPKWFLLLAGLVLIGLAVVCLLFGSY